MTTTTTTTRRKRRKRRTRTTTNGTNGKRGRLTTAELLRKQGEAFLTVANFLDTKK